jgi:diamine N-acetyltransferase
MEPPSADVEHPGLVTIRPGTPDDASVLAAFGAVTFRSTYAETVPTAALEAFIDTVFGDDLQAEELRDPACAVAVAERAGRLLGYLLLRDATPPPSVAGDRPLAISRLYVAPDAQGEGVGTALLVHAVSGAQARGHDLLWLTVWDRNPRAIAVYERWGFVDVGEVDFDLAGVTQTDRVFVLRLEAETREPSSADASPDASASRVAT